MIDTSVCMIGVFKASPFYHLYELCNMLVSSYGMYVPLNDIIV